jgi:ferric-dicitrate binding protein FerR (iron transport regulator)
MSCDRLRGNLVGVLEGTADHEHIAGCDACRDAAHSLEQLAARIAKAGDDFVVSEALSERLVALANEGVRDRISETRIRAEAEKEAAATPDKPSWKSKRSLALIIAACLSIGASAVVGVKIADHQRSPAAAATRAWHGKVAKIVRSGADAAAQPGLTSGGKPLLEGAEIQAGMKIATDGRTRARLWLDDGSVIVLDRATEITVDGAPRTVTLNDGAILADVAHVDAAPWAKVKTPHGEVKVLGTKFAVTSASDRTNVEVLRGEVDVAGQKVSAGQEGVVGKDGKVDIAPANDLAQRSAFGEQLISTHNEDTDAPASGLGELRAKRPGRTDEKDHAVRLQKHAVKVRIAGAVARTEIDETFANDTDDELEGIYRFPLPPGAQIERLALEVDGKLVDGEFIDKSKASAIWRGAIQNAAPKAPKPREEIVWVPGPWHDPALLEWQRGGRFELKIFPIPKRGSRRVVIAYTETVAPVSGVRRYVYPLPQGSSSNITIDQFSLDAQVLGHDAKVPVRARGYELQSKSESNAERLTSAMSSFTPSGDLAIEYGLDDKKTDATAWAYRASAHPIATPAVGPPSAGPSGDGKDPIGADPFVAIALRPKLPKWSESKPRDQVIVVDAGRAMFGERFERAKRLAIQMTQEMDRRDRVTVLACDVTCKALPGGFVAPGAPSAHDVDAFLRGVTPDGASDLVGAVRAATKVSRDAGRDLRISLLSDGVATAGYRSAGRVSTEVGDALGDLRSMVVSVPIGADADVNLLSDVARGGGGVVVPYQPGQRLEATALEVLNATYGTTLRDVEVVLPEGLRDAAPAAIAPLRAGSETIVTARMSGDSVKGDLVLRGKVGGDVFEARYPIDVRATTDAGNAFVPRLFAAARIADRERQANGAGDAAKAELVALSRRFAVPSKTTSLLVLESEAMFKAFGIERAEHAPQWTGESQAQATVVASTKDEEEESGSLAALGHIGGADANEKKKELFAEGAGASAGPATRGAAPPAPAPSMAAPPAKAASRSRVSLDRDDAWSDDLSRSIARRPPGGRLMKKIFVRRATLSQSTSPAVSTDAVTKARAAVAAAPDERSKHKDLARVLALSGQLDELGEVLEKWSTRDPLDADVITARADLAARRGDREAALRILGGALSGSALNATDAFTFAQAIGRSHDRLGKTEACAFHIAAAEMKSTDAEAVARAVTCERAQGRGAAADRWLSGFKDGRAVQAAITKLESQKSEGTFGDVVVSANWTGGADLDIALLDPAGRRAGAVTRMKNARIEGATSRERETVALSSGEAGAFIVEMVRANASEGTIPVSGTLTIKAFGQTQSIPFTLTGARTQVGRADVRWESELVPLDNTVGIINPTPATFNSAAAASALASVNVQHCASHGQVGTGHVTVTFGPAGRVVDVAVDDANFSGTVAGRCVQSAFFNAAIAPFAGNPARVGKSFTLGVPVAR